MRKAIPLTFVASLVLVGACKEAATADDVAAVEPEAGAGACAVPVAQPVEWVGYHTEVPLLGGDVHGMIAGWLGTDAQAGRFAQEVELAPHVFVKAEAEPTTPDQARLVVAFDDGTTQRRPIAVAPASFQLGQLWGKVVDAGVAKMTKDAAASPGGGESFLLEYRITSAQGGRLSLGVRGNGGVFSFVLDVATPHTSLVVANLGKPALTDAPYDTVAGTVDFHMSRDDFAYFTDHAYGKGATSKQNFVDFALVPHDWLRLTVDPHLDQKFVDVGFELLTPAGERIPVAKAPASVYAGDTFRSLVLTNMSTMAAQEKAKAGSSTPWQAPFYYDAPGTGGVVQVIAQGTAGSYSVAYSIESPQHALKDVPAFTYQDVVIPPPSPTDSASCDQLGDPSIHTAPAGTLDITFTASDVVKTSPDLHGPLQGTIYCAVYHASDVTVEGPNQGAQSVQDFQVPNADLAASTAPTFTTQQLLDGKYQILCAQDLDHSGGASKGDPVTLPIGGFTVACNKNPVTVEFALLDPEN